MCGISLGVLVMFNVRLINSTNKPNKQLSVVEQQQLFGVGREDLVFLYGSGAQFTHSALLVISKCMLLTLANMARRTGLQQFSTFKMYCREALFQLRNHCKHILLIFYAMSVK